MDGALGSGEDAVTFYRADVWRCQADTGLRHPCVQQATVFVSQTGGRRYGTLGWNGTFIAVAGDPWGGVIGVRQSLDELSDTRAVDLSSISGLFQSLGAHTCVRDNQADVGLSQTDILFETTRIS